MHQNFLFVLLNQILKYFRNYFFQAAAKLFPTTKAEKTWMNLSTSQNFFSSENLALFWLSTSKVFSYSMSKTSKGSIVFTDVSVKFEKCLWTNLTFSFGEVPTLCWSSNWRSMKVKNRAKTNRISFRR